MNAREAFSATMDAIINKKKDNLAVKLQDPEFVKTIESIRKEIAYRTQEGEFKAIVDMPRPQDTKTVCQLFRNEGYETTIKTGRFFGSPFIEISWGNLALSI